MQARVGGDTGRALLRDDLSTPHRQILEPPAGYAPIRTPSRKLMATPTPLVTGFRIGDTPARDAYGVPATPGELQHGVGGAAGANAELPFVKSEDLQYFGKLLEAPVRAGALRGGPRDMAAPPAPLPLQKEGAPELSPEEVKERTIMTLLLKIKNGTPPQRKAAMRQVRLLLLLPLGC